MDENNSDSISDSILRLEDLSVIAVASHFCNLINVKKKIEDFLYEFDPSWQIDDSKLLNESYLSELLNKISDVFLKEFSRQGLPPTLKQRVLEKCLEIAEQIHDWILHLMTDLKLERKYTDKIYLTSYGKIDIDKIFKCHWMNFTSDRSLFDDRIRTLHYLACMFFQKEYIIENKTDVINEIHAIMPLVHAIIPLEMNNDIVFSIMKFLICAYSKSGQWSKSEPSNIISAKFLSLSNLELLKICWSLVLYKPFTYFWDYLNESQKSSFLQNMSRINRMWLPQYSNDSYLAENLFKIVTFLTDKMSASQIDHFVLQFFNNIPWIYQESKFLKKFCVLFVHKFLPRLSEISEYDFLNWIFRYEKISLNCDILFKCVFNHEIFKDRKDYALDFGRERYKDLISENNFIRLNQLMDLSLETENEKNHFKMRYNFLRDWIFEEKLYEVDNVLKWMRTLSQTDKWNIILEQLKYPLELIIIVKLLKWFAGTDSEPLINNCEDRSSLMDLTREIIYIFWFSENDSLANLSSEILKCVFGNENEIINFKRSELAKDEVDLVKFFCDMELEMNEEDRANFSRIDEFFNFCLSEEKIKAVKKLIADDVEAWIEYYGVSVRRFNVVVPLVDWIYGSENESCEMLKKYFENHKDLENYYQSLK